MFDFLTQPKVLRPHQERAIGLVRHSLGKGNRRVVLQMPTGGGKTLTAAKIIQSARSKGKKVIFTAPAITLIDQTVEAFEAEGITGIGVMQADHPRTDPSAPVQVASVHTLARRDVPDAALVIVDECHIHSKAIAKLMDERSDVFFVGLSATPWAKGMGKQWQDLCVAATTADMIRDGYLCDFRVFAAAHPDLTGVRTVAGEYQQDQLCEAMSEGKLVGGIVEHWLQYGAGRPTLVFAVNRAHAAKIHEAFMRAGVASAYVDKDTDRAERQHIERQFRDGEIQVACSVRTLTTGVDWPVACIVDAAPTKSVMLHVQKIGRGLRVNPGFDDCLILDHSDNTLRLGFVTDIHRTALSDKDRPEVGRQERSEPLPKECSQCSAIIPPKVNPCPSCGHERKAQAGVEEVEGDLVEVKKGKAKATWAEKQAWWSGLLKIAADRKRSRGWAAHTYREKFGVWPRGLDDVAGPAAPEVWSYVKAKDIRFAKRKQVAA